MKKILMTIAAAFVAVTMSAQIYVGGSVAVNSFSSQKFAGDRSETAFKFMPEVGYNLNEEWAIGCALGYESDKFNMINDPSGNFASESAFSINPYARYTYLKAGKVNLFVDGGVEFTSASKADWTRLAFGVKPGLAVNLTDQISFVSHLGFIGFDQINPDGDDNNTTKVGVDLSGANLTFGLYFNF